MCYYIFESCSVADAVASSSQSQQNIVETIIFPSTATMIERETVMGFFLVCLIAMGGSDGQNTVSGNISQAGNNSDLVATYRTPLESFAANVFAPAVAEQHQSKNDNPLVNWIASIVSTNLKPFAPAIDFFKKTIETTYPGTLWCGRGTTAGDDNRLGILREIDACCRAHDMCDSNILAGQSKFRLLNNGIFTRSECSCDNTFYKCLMSVNVFEKIMGNKIGFTYFSVLRPQCFSFEHPIVSCAKHDSSGVFLTMRQRKCLEYKLDEGKAKKFQWFDNPNWFNISL